MEGMNLYKHGPSWYCRFTSHKGKVCKLRAARNKRDANLFARNVAALVDAASMGAAISDDLLDWVEALDSKRTQRLIDWGLVDEKRMALKETIYQQMQRWHDGLLNRGRSEDEARKRHNRAKAIAEACGWKLWRDVDGEDVLACLEQWRRDGKTPGFKRHSTVSERTLSHYLASIKQFSNWMYRSGYATKDPLAVLSVERRKARNDAVPSNMAQRRPLTNSEQRKLITAVAQGEVRNSMAGEGRALLYRIALQTGLRASVIRRLRCGDVDPQGWLMARCGGATNKRTTPKPISGKLLELLSARAGGRDAEDALFEYLPHPVKWAPMLRADCEAAGIDTAGVDFHCLRHTFGTTLARQGVHPKTLMSLMDHTDINMTMRLYTHSMPGDEVAAMDLLPDLDGMGVENHSKIA